MIFLAGKCESYATESECLSAREGVKCVWAGSQKCLLKEDAKKMKNTKIIEDFIVAHGNHCPKHNGIKYLRSKYIRFPLPTLKINGTTYINISFHSYIGLSTWNDPFSTFSESVARQLYFYFNLDGSRSVCASFKSCPSCTENSHDCVWCEDRCTSNCEEGPVSPTRFRKPKCNRNGTYIYLIENVVGPTDFLNFYYWFK